jgi:hypothetical protein
VFYFHSLFLAGLISSENFHLGFNRICEINNPDDADSAINYISQSIYSAGPIFYLMTERPVFSDSRRRPIYAAVALTLVLGALLLAAGCIEPGYQPNRDVGVVKLTDTGNPEWSTLVTTGKDTISHDIIEASDGSYILMAAIAERKNSGNLLPHPIKISHDGQILWDNPVNKSDCGSYILILDDKGNVIQLFHQGILCPALSIGEYAENSSMNFSVHGMVKETGDGEYVLGGYKKESHLLTKDEFVKRRQIKLNEQQEYAEKMWIPYCENATPANDEYGYCTTTPVINGIITKSTTAGIVSWQRIFPNYTADSVSVIEMKNGKGYIASFGNTVVRLGPEGTVMNTTPLGKVPEYSPPPPGRTLTENYSILLGSTALLFDKEGMITNVEPLPGQTGTPTRDGGFLIIDARVMQSSRQYAILSFATKYNPDGSTDWEKHIISPYAFSTPTRVIQTSDGGYIVLSVEDNQSARR